MKHFRLYLRLLIIINSLGLSAAWGQNDLWADDSLRYKIGQMIIFGFNGSTAPAIVLDEITQYNPGGVLLYRVYHNLENTNQAANLVTDLQQAALSPLLIATDQEGGRVTNLRASNGFQDSPSAYTMGLQNSETYTRGVAAMFSSWFTAIGLNTNFAPVVDLRLNPGNVIDDRSFSADPDIVTQNAYWFCDEFHLNHQLTTLKHFPGHGSSEGDSHLGFTDVTETWQEIELEPYAALLDSNCIDLIMTAHIFNATLDSVYPATLSQATIQGLLRDTLGYDGVVVTDAMMMGAITQNYGLTEAVTLAINAGVDMLLYNWDDDQQGHRLLPLLVDHIACDVQNETIPRNRIETSFRRIQRLKSHLDSPAALHGLPAIPADFTLANFPNPFNGATTIRYETREDAGGQLKIYNVRGAMVYTQAIPFRPAGRYSLTWSGTDLSGHPVSTGVYVCRIQLNEVSKTRKMVLIK